MFGAKPRSDAREGMTLISEEAYFHGTLSAKGSLRVEGTFEGDIADAVEVSVGAKGRVLGNVAAETLILAGEIVGNVVASQSVELLATAKLSGDLRTPKLKVEEGAHFDGACSMAGGAAPPRRRRGKADEAEPLSIDALSERPS